jgi:hypothetical protein
MMMTKPGPHYDDDGDADDETHSCCRTHQESHRETHRATHSGPQVPPENQIPYYLN